MATIRRDRRTFNCHTQLSEPCDLFGEGEMSGDGWWAPLSVQSGAPMHSSDADKQENEHSSSGILHHLCTVTMQ